MSDEDKIKISKMPRKEINSEILHCWREQEELVLKIQRLEKERDVYKEAFEEMKLISSTLGESKYAKIMQSKKNIPEKRMMDIIDKALAKGAEIAEGKC